jgi:2',3'-cyclic-nucleotide 2'-phosphodiesterase (5'-nucleotidase family)
MVLRALFAISLAILFTSCSVFRPAVAEEDEPELEYPGPDSEILRMLDGHRGALDRQMGVKIATIKDTLRFDKPEGALGNMVSDAIRNRAGNELGRYINVGIIGESSFKLFFEPGQLTLGELYEFMPYENHLVVLTLSGDKVYELVNQVAALGGAPISGVRFRIDDDNKARGVLVNSEVIDPDKKYRIATSSWAANGGDVFPALWEAEERIDLDVSVRTVFVDYFRGRSEIYDFTDGRIRK